LPLVSWRPVAAGCLFDAIHALDHHSGLSASVQALQHTGSYALARIRRAENTDNSWRFVRILSWLEEKARTSVIVLPCTRERQADGRARHEPRVRLVALLTNFDTWFVPNANEMFTGSGGPAEGRLFPPCALHDPAGRTDWSRLLPQAGVAAIAPGSPSCQNKRTKMSFPKSYLSNLEAEAIGILRETFASFERPVILYSIGKDSSVLLHLARKAFFPGRISLPVLHIDTGWKFRDMIAFRDRIAMELGLDLRVYTNREAALAGVTPFTWSSVEYNDHMKTRALRLALERWKSDAAVGGARRDEEKSRAKERIFSVRSEGQRWDPRKQRPELWNLYNTRLGPSETMRVFPLSNWTERDIWHYIYQERIEIVPLYFASPRPVVRRKGTWVMVDDERMPIERGETIVQRWVRFRTLGCYPNSGAIESSAVTLADILVELEETRSSEREGRLIDADQVGSMERKKREGYF
jgi:sulfate adenylyltransferase subunit 2